MSKRLSMEESLKQGASDILVKALLGGLEGIVREISNNIDWSKFSLKDLFASPKAKQDPDLPEVIASIELLGILQSIRERIHRLDTLGHEIPCEVSKAKAEEGRVYLKDALSNTIANLQCMAVAGSQAAGAALICFSTYGLDYFKRSYIAGTNDYSQRQSPTAIRFYIHPED